MPSATVVGAGVFGASTARALAQRGWDVTLVEQYVPGTVRSASGGDTRLLRAAHGDVDWYAELVLRARAQWLELQERRGVRIFEPIGVAWFARRADGFEARSRAASTGSASLRVARARRGAPAYPSLGVDDLEAVLFEPEAGVLHARRATQLLVEDALELGVRVETARLHPADPPRSDVVVWACGAWLPALFPSWRRSRSRAATSSSSAVTAGGRARPASATTTARSTGTARSRAWASRSPPHAAVPRSIRTRSSACRRPTGSGRPRLRRPALPRARRRAGRGSAGVPVQPHRRHPLPLRGAPRARGLVAAGRRLGARLQARPGPGRLRRQTASRDGGRPSPSTPSGRGPATPACAPASSAESL